MTNRNRRSGQQMGTLKAFLITGSVIATLAGTQLLAKQGATAETGVSPTEAVTLVVPAAEALPMPPTTTTTIGDRSVQIQLAPVPQAITPQINPVVRTRSSR